MIYFKIKNSISQKDYFDRYFDIKADFMIKTLKIKKMMLKNILDFFCTRKMYDAYHFPTKNLNQCSLLYNQTYRNWLGSAVYALTSSPL